MILSLISRFKFLNRRMMFVSAHKAAVYHWQGGRLGTSYLFDGNEEGRAYFERYLNETDKTPTYILTDFFEEEYRQDTIPHVMSPDRNAMLQRKKSRLFRDTPYYFSRIIGREEDGRRDDRVLMTAITNPDLVTPWAQLLDNYKVPLVGIYSVPLFTETVIKYLDNPPNHLLVVTLQSLSGLRQTFFDNKQFRISRLVQMPRYGTEPYAPHIREEVEKIRRYLNSMRLISPEEPLEICFILSGELLDELKQELEESSLVHYQFYEINDLLKSAGAEAAVTTPFSDRLFAQLLLKHRPGNFYASPSERRYHTMRKLRYGMTVTAGLALAASSVWSGLNLMDGLSFKQRSLISANKTGFYSDRYQMARERLPDTPVEPSDLKVAVDLANKLQQYKTSPLQMFRAVSSALGPHPSIKVDEMQWGVSMDPNMNVGQDSGPVARQPSGNIGYSNLSVADTGYDYYQVARIDGHLEPFTGDYRSAIDRINEFADLLRSKESIHDVSILTLPLDVSSDTNLQGNANIEGREARFSIRVVLGISNAA